MDYILPIIIVLAIVLVVLIILQRRQRANNQVVPPPDIGQPIDYTNPDIKEPTTFADRFRNAPLALKLLIPLVLVAVLILGYVGVRLLQPASNTVDLLPTAEPTVVTEISATLRNATSILVQANTNLANQTEVEAQLLEDGQPFAWNTPESAQSTVSNGRVQINLVKQADGPAPTNGRTYTIVLTASGSNGAITTEPVALVVPQLYASAFYSAAASEPITASTSTPADAAEVSTPEPTATAAPATETPTPVATATLTATVANGGNVRAAPNLNGEVLDQNDAFDVVTLLQKTADGTWYQVTNPRNITGWFSASLLSIDPDVAAQVPVEGTTPVTPPAATTATPAADDDALTAIVANGGNVRAAPNLNGEVLDQNDAADVVTLLQKTADGAWYQITNPRNVTGWFSASLLTIEPDVAAQVPIAE